MTKRQARKLTDGIKGAVSIVWDLIVKAYTELGGERPGLRSWTTTAPVSSAPAGCGCPARNVRKLFHRCGIQG